MGSNSIQWKLEFKEGETQTGLDTGVPATIRNNGGFNNITKFILNAFDMEAVVDPIKKKFTVSKDDKITEYEYIEGATSLVYFIKNLKEFNLGETDPIWAYRRVVVGTRKDEEISLVVLDPQGFVTHMDKLP